MPNDMCQFSYDEILTKLEPNRKIRKKITNEFRKITKILERLHLS